MVAESKFHMLKDKQILVKRLVQTKRISLFDDACM